MIKADADLILAIHHLKNNLKIPVDCRHMYGHQDGKNKKKQEKWETALEEEIEEYACEIEAESSKSKAEAMMMRTFQIGEKRQPKRPQKNGLKAKQDLWDKEGHEEKLMDEAMMNITCNEIATDTTAAALGGEAPYPDTVMELPYAGSRAMLRIKQTWITSKYKTEIYKARRTGPMRIYCA